MFNFIIISMLFSNIAMASEEEGLKCSQNGTSIYYINGVLTGWKDGNKSAKNIFKNIVDKNEKLYDLSGKVDVQFIHNTTRGAFADIQELHNQGTRNMTKAQTREFYKEKLKVNLRIGQPTSRNVVDFNNDRKRLVEYADTAFKFIFSKDNQEKPFDEKALSSLDVFKKIFEIDSTVGAFLLNIGGDVELTSKIKNAFKSMRQENKKIIVIAHSQGNTAINYAVRNYRYDTNYNPSHVELDNFDKVFGILHLASPAAGSALETDNEAFVRLNRDFVIKGATLIMPENPTAATHRFESSSLTIFDKVILLGPIAEFIAGIFKGTLYHGMDEVYLSDSINASAIGSTSTPEAMKEIFKHNLAKVAKSLDDNCGDPAIKISSLNAVVSPNDISVLNINGYAGTERKVKFQVEDVAGTSIQNYDNKLTQFSYKLTTARPASGYGLYYIPYKETVLEGVVEAIEGVGEIEIPIPYRDYVYTLSVTAKNNIGKESTIFRKIAVPNDKERVFTFSNERCMDDENDDDSTIYMFFDIAIKDDSYIYDGLIEERKVSGEIGITQFNYLIPGTSWDWVSLEIYNKCKY